MMKMIQMLDRHGLFRWVRPFGAEPILPQSVPMMEAIHGTARCGKLRLIFRPVPDQLRSGVVDDILPAATEFGVAT
jgi:hypothetical protein